MSPWEYLITKAKTVDDLLVLLERFLSSDDYVEEDNGEMYVVERRVRLDAVDGYKVEIYPDEHPPPHFHIVKDNKKLAAYAISDCRKLTGNLPNGIERKIRFWHQWAREKLVRSWNDTRPGEYDVSKTQES
jgi:hypothetical protein